MTPESASTPAATASGGAIAEDNRDQAWVRIRTELVPAELLAFVQEDPERLLRINSMYEFLAWQKAGRDTFVVHFRNRANGRALETTLGIERAPDGLIVRYGGGLKAATVFRVEPGAGGSGADLIVTDDYSRVSEAERAARLAEVDNSLNWWGQDLYRYLTYRRRWGWFSGWNWYMERVWKPMKPTARRIVYILYVITVVEIVAIVVAVAIFGFGWNEYFGNN